MKKRLGFQFQMSRSGTDANASRVRLKMTRGPLFSDEGSYPVDL
jgi:hypothetical protein